MPYTRAQLLAAYRQDFPKLAKVSDNDLFIAIAQDSPELAKGISELQQTPAAAPDDRSAGQVAFDQTGKVLKGIAGTITGIPGAIAEVGKAVVESGTGNQTAAGKRLANMGKGMAHSIADPFTPIIRTGVEAVAPGSTGGPATQQEWEQGAEAAGGNLGNLLMMKAGPKVNAMLQPESLMTKAARARALVAKASDTSIPMSKTGATIAVAKAAGRPVLNAAATLAEKAAKIRAGKPAPVAAVSNVEMPGGYGGGQPAAPVGVDAVETAVPEMEVPQGGRPHIPEMRQNYNKTLDLQRRATDAGVDVAGMDPHPPTPKPGFPAGDVPELNPATARIGVTDEAGNYNKIHEGPSPLDGREPYVRGTVKREPVTQITGPNGETQFPNEVVPQADPTPGTDPYFDHVGQFEQPEDLLGYTPEAAPEGQPMAEAAPEAQASQVPPEAPGGPQEQPMDYPIQKLDPDLETTVDAVIRRGKGTGAAFDAQLNAPYLLELMPELRGIADGPKFDAMLYNKLQTVGHELATKMESIPGDKIVSTGEAAAKLNEIADRAAQSYQGSEANAIKRLKELMGDSGTTRWDKITDIKKNMWDKLDITSGPGKEAYKVFKELVEKVDPSLAKINRDYFTLKTSSELAGMDPGGLRNGAPRPGGGTRPKAEAQSRIDSAKAAKKAAEDAAKKAAKDAELEAKNAGKKPGKTDAEKAAEQAAKDAEKAKRVADAKKLRDAERAEEETKRRQEKLASDAQVAREGPNRMIRGGRL
jgi:hypothetical protein